MLIGRGEKAKELEQEIPTIPYQIANTNEQEIPTTNDPSSTVWAEPLKAIQISIIFKETLDSFHKSSMKTPRGPGLNVNNLFQPLYLQKSYIYISELRG